MPFLSHDLDSALQKKLDALIDQNDFPDLYRRYSWKNDTYANSFPDVYALERQLTSHERSIGVTIDDVKDVARWGAMRNQARIHGPAIVLQQNKLTDRNGLPDSNIDLGPEGPISDLDAVRGLGPTYKSKVLRFALPAEYGAIDTRCVRVFGQGDAAAGRHDWLSLTAVLGRHKGRASGWYIPAKQPAWPRAFGTWTNILRYIAAGLTAPCPHTSNFVTSGLRRRDIWACADVEMALFTYASQFT